MDTAPAWFQHAIATTPRSGRADIDGARIHWLGWGERGRPGIVLVHGGAAHARWWSHIAPFLTSSYHVVAIDLSGHGDSDWREEYSGETWAREVVEIAASDGMVGSPVIVGHSMGGGVAMTAAALFPDDVPGIVIVDTPVTKPDPESDGRGSGRMLRNPKRYPTLEEAKQHFHLVPPQPFDDPHLRDWVAGSSLRQTEDGDWAWKFDPAMPRSRSGPAWSEMLAQVRCRVAVFHGELSAIVNADVNAYMNDLLGRTAPFVEIPQAHHHLILDQPLAFVAALRAILADWEHSMPRR